MSHAPCRARAPPPRRLPPRVPSPSPCQTRRRAACPSQDVRADPARRTAGPVEILRGVDLSRRGRRARGGDRALGLGQVVADLGWPRGLSGRPQRRGAPVRDQDLGGAGRGRSRPACAAGRVSLVFQSFHLPAQHDGGGERRRPPERSTAAPTPLATARAWLDPRGPGRGRTRHYPAPALGRRTAAAWRWPGRSPCSPGAAIRRRAHGQPGRRQRRRRHRR